MLKTYITDFAAYCKVTDFSGKSLQSLNASLQDFSTFIDEQQIESIEAIGYGHLSGFVADYKAPSIHKKKARVWCLHQFFHFLTLSDRIKENIALGLAYPKIEKTVPQFLTAAEFNRIVGFSAINVDLPYGFRDLVLLLMLGLLGLRAATVTALDAEHIDTESGLVWVTEKGRNQRQMVVPETLNTLLKVYLTEHHTGSGPLFLSKRNKRLSPRLLQEIFRNLADSVDIKKHLHAHLFRHTAATHLNKVAGTAVTQAVLGHARRYNTLKYSHLNPDIYATYMKRHPFMQEVRS